MHASLVRVFFQQRTVFMYQPDHGVRVMRFFGGMGEGVELLFGQTEHLAHFPYY
ncbi:hypothetical protein D9M69_579830 [compost metagenome]